MPSANVHVIFIAGRRGRERLGAEPSPSRRILFNQDNPGNRGVFNSAAAVARDSRSKWWRSRCANPRRSRPRSSDTQTEHWLATELQLLLVAHVIGANLTA